MIEVGRLELERVRMRLKMKFVGAVGFAMIAAAFVVSIPAVERSSSSPFAVPGLVLVLVPSTVPDT